MPEKAVGRRKSGQGDGSYEKLPDGRVRWRIMVTTYSGEHKRPSGTAANMTEAKRAVKEVQRAAERHDVQTKKEYISINALVAEYIQARYRAGKIKRRTLEDYQYMLDHYISPSIGQLKAQQVDGNRLKIYFDTLETRKGGVRTREKIHSLLRAAYRWGIAENKVAHDPTRSGRPKPADQPVAEKKNVFEPEEAERFYIAAREHRFGWPLALMLALGLRPGEALGLTWKDADFQEDGSVVLNIQRTRSVSQGKVYEGPPKTIRAKRLMRATGDVALMLTECRELHEQEKELQMPIHGHPYQVTDYMFTTLAGTGWRPDNLNVPMRRICEGAGLTVLTPQMLRRTYASVMGAGGYALEVISKQLGHSNTVTTDRFYRKVFDSERADMTFDPISGKRADE